MAECMVDKVISLMVTKKDRKRVSMQKMVTLNSSHDVTCLEFSCYHTTLSLTLFKNIRFSNLNIISDR